MATTRPSDLRAEMIYKQKCKIKLYIPENRIKQLTADANALGMNRNVLLECLIIKYLSEMNDAKENISKIQAKEKSQKAA